MFKMFDGYKTYLVMGALLAVVAVEKLMGVDIPGVTVGDEWLAYVLAALGLGGLKSAVAKVV